MRALALALSACCLGGALSAQTIYYVDAFSGNDLNTGLSPSTAKRTINAAVSAAWGDSTTLDTINVLPGVYQESVYVWFDLRIEGRPGAEIQPGNAPAFTIDSGLYPITSFTQVKNLRMQGVDASSGVELAGENENSARIENNEIVDFSRGIHVFVGGQEAVHRPLIRYNTITQSEEDPAPLFVGIDLGPEGTADLEAVVHGNRISFFEYGIWCHNIACKPSIRCDFIRRCEWGILCTDLADVRVTHETVAYGAPASFVPTVYGIQVSGATLDLANSLVWIPDGPGSTPAYCGVDLDGPITVVSTISEDCGPPACAPFTPTYPTICITDPLFVDVSSGDLRLSALSPAIDVADPLYVWPAPTGTDPVDHDVLGGPRLIDPFRTGTLLPDCGAHEYTEVDLDCVTQGMFSGAPMVDAEIGSSLFFTLRGLPNDLGYFWFAPDVYEMNFMVNPLGNLLVYPLSIVPVTMTNDSSGLFSTGTLSLFVPPLTSLVETEQSFQAALIGGARSVSTAPGPAYAISFCGNMTRRIEVEFNVQ